MARTEEDNSSASLHPSLLHGLPQIGFAIALCLASGTLFICWEDNALIFPALVVVGVACGGRPLCCALALAASKTFLILGSILLSMRGLSPGWWLDFSYLQPSLCSFALDSALFVVVGYPAFVVWHAAIIRNPLRMREFLCPADAYWLAFFCTVVPLLILGVTFDHNSRLLRQQYAETKALDFSSVCELAKDPKESLRKRSLALLMLPEKSRGTSIEKAKQVAAQVLTSEGPQGPLVEVASLSYTTMEAQEMVAKITGDAVSPFEYLDYGWTCYSQDEREFYENMRRLGLAEEESGHKVKTISESSGR